jgi:hypothetical protein
MLRILYLAADVFDKLGIWRYRHYQIGALNLGGKQNVRGLN